MTGQPATNTSEVAADLKKVLRFMPAPVGIVTGTDPETGEPVGLAMSALMPVSLEPSAMAVAINRSGASHAALLSTGRFCINLLHPGSSEHMAPFALPDRRSDRFRIPGWVQRNGAWYLEAAPANIFCRIVSTLQHGTHDLVIGEVEHVIATDETGILGWANGRLGTLVPLD